MFQRNNEGMGEFRTNRFLIQNHTLSLILLNEFLGYCLESIKLAIIETSNKIDFTKSSNGKTFNYFIFLQRLYFFIPKIMHALEIHSAVKYSIPNSNPIIK